MFDKVRFDELIRMADVISIVQRTRKGKNKKASWLVRKWRRSEPRKEKSQKWKKKKKRSGLLKFEHPFFRVVFAFSVLEKKIGEKKSNFQTRDSCRKGTSAKSSLWSWSKSVNWNLRYTVNWFKKCVYREKRVPSIFFTHVVSHCTL